jgi:predicted transcriptional regulator
MKDKSNIYYRARMLAARQDPLHASRERTACMIFVSAEALYDYENGLTVPGCDVVQKMVEAYADPDLKAAHIRACCPLLPDYGGEETSELARAALGWALAFESAQQVALRFAAVARDGRVTPDELPAVAAIRAKAVELRRVMEETITAIDKAAAQAGKQAI